MIIGSDGGQSSHQFFHGEEEILSPPPITYGTSDIGLFSVNPSGVDTIADSIIDLY